MADKTTSYLSLADMIPQEIWPEDTLQSNSDGENVFENIAYEDIQFLSSDQGISLEISGRIIDEVVFPLPFFDSIGFVIGGNGANDSDLVTIQFNIDWSGQQVNYSCRIQGTFKIRFARDILMPVKIDSSTNSYVTDDDPESFVEIDIPVNVLVNKGGVIDFDFGSSSQGFSLSPCMVGNSGVIIQASNVMFCFSADSVQNLPAAANVSKDFRGVYIGGLGIQFPKEIACSILPNKLQLGTFSIGSGGISGSISASWNPQLSSDNKSFTGDGAGTIFGIPFALVSVGMTFVQNALTQCDIKGAIILPFFNQPALVDIGFTTNGDFSVALSADQTNVPGGNAPQKDPSSGLFVFQQPNLLQLTVSSLAFESQDGEYVISIGGSIQPLIRSPELTWPTFDVNSLSIDSQGHVKISGGWLNLSNQKSFNFYAFIASLTKIGFGSNSDGSKWIGVSGGIKLVDGIPLAGNVDGLKIVWGGPSGDISLQVSGIGISFEIKEVLQASGNITFIDDQTTKGFKGGVKMTVYPLAGASLDVQMMVGKNTQSPPFTFFYIYTDVELPAGIPLFASGLSLYGLAGLFGYNVAPGKGQPPGRPDESWYENPDGTPGWYKRGKEGVTDTSKWIDQFESMAFGAGVTLGTTPDNGFTFSGKTLIILLIPGPTIIVEGLANFLKDRKQIDNPIFRILAVFDNKAGTFLLNIEADYNIPDNGKVLSITALAEAFFNFNDPSQWHLYIGQEKPAEKMIRAKILSLFEADAYFMIDNNGFRIGGQIVYQKNWTFVSILKVSIDASISGEFILSFKPPEAQASMDLEGKVQLSVFSFTLGLVISADLAIETPKPFSINAAFDVKLDLPWPLPSPKAHVELKWQDPPNPPPFPVPVANIGIEHLKVTEKWPLGGDPSNSGTPHAPYPTYDQNGDGVYDGSQSPVQEPADAYQNSPTVPLDGKPVIIFNKSVDDNALLSPSTAAQAGSGIESRGGYNWGYSLQKIILEKQSKSNLGSWVTVAIRSHNSSENVGDLEAMWQVPPGYSAQSKNLKLMLWTNTAFELTRGSAINNGPSYDQYTPCNINTNLPCTPVNFESYKSNNEGLPPIFVDGQTIFLCKNNPAIVDYDAPWVLPNPTKHALLFAGRPDLVRIWYRYLEILKNKQDSKKKLTLTAPKIDIAELALTGINYTKLITTATNDVATNLQDGMDVSNTMLEYFKNPTVILIIFPVEVSKVDIYFGKGTAVRVATFKDLKSIEGYTNVIIPVDQSDANMGPKTVKAKGGGPFKGIVLYGVGLISEICYVTAQQMELIAYNTILLESMQQALEESWSHTDTVLEPGMYYRITVNTQVTRNSDTQAFSQYVYFQTDDPPGVYTQSASSDNNDAYPVGGPLKDLSAYVDTTIPASGQKPVYRTYDIGIVFNESYVEQMYESDNLDLLIKLSDNNDKPVVDSSGKEIKLQNQWENNPQVSLTTSEQQWVSTINSSGCANLDYTDVSSSQNLYGNSNDLVLLPETLYKARLIATDGMNDSMLYAFSFITSKFATFLHHIQSFQDALWDNYKIQGTDPLISAKDKTSLEQLLGNLKAGNSYDHDSESVMFEQISTLFNLGIRQLPSVMEILSLNDNSRPYGLLMESPEPIDWLRTTVTAGFSDAAPKVSEASKSIKVIGASVSSSGGHGTNYNDEWIDILVRDDYDINGVTVQHLSDGQKNPSNYYTFNSENKIPSGTVIRIHTGKQADDANPSPEVEHKYLGLGAWQLSSDGETIQVNDNQGNAIHTRHVDSDGTFNTSSIIMIRNPDGTRAFIFFPSNSERAGAIKNGKYRLEFQFQRNIGPTAPNLKRRGSDNAEDTTIEFSYPPLLP